MNSKLDYLSRKIRSKKLSLINIFWLFSDKAIKLAIGLFIVAVLARYLGPENYGKLNFALAVIAIMEVVTALGLKGVLVTKLSKRPNDQLLIIGSAFFLRLSVSTIVFILFSFLINIYEIYDTLTKNLMIILAFGMIFKSSQVINYWFESQIKSKYTVWCENTVFLIASLLKFIVVYYDYGVYVISLVLTLESILIFFFSIYIYQRFECSVKLWSFSIDKSISLLKESWPLIISSASWIIYTRVDQIMIKWISGDQGVGYYSAAVRISDLINIIPSIIAFSILPMLIKDKLPMEVLNRKFQDLYDIVIGFTIGICLFVTCFSFSIVTIIFSDKFSISATVLNIHAWSAVFISMATISGRYLINIGYQKITMYRHLIGILLNVPLNYFLIPQYGIVGAAYGTLLSLFFSNIIFDYFSIKTRVCFYHKLKAIFFIRRLVS